MWIWFTPFSILLWYGLWLSRRALYALVIIPIPVILSSGLYLVIAGSMAGRWLLAVGMVASIVSGLLVSARYNRIPNERNA
jgi:hypothetical protein